MTLSKNVTFLTLLSLTIFNAMVIVSYFSHKNIKILSLKTKAKKMLKIWTDGSCLGNPGQKTL